MLVVATTEGTLLIYTLGLLNPETGVYNQVDSKFQNLKRDSAELFVKETIPNLTLKLTAEVPLYVPITCINCVSISQLMVATKSTKILRIRWDGQEERDFSLDLQRIPFSINQQVSYAVPIVENKIYVTSMDYSPLVGGFAVVLSDGRAAFLTANNLKFDPNVCDNWIFVCKPIFSIFFLFIFSKFRAFGPRISMTPAAPASTTSTG